MIPKLFNEHKDAVDTAKTLDKTSDGYPVFVTRFIGPSITKIIGVPKSGWYLQNQFTKKFYI